MYDVLVTGLEFTGHHGVTDHEKRVGCRLRVDIRVTVDGQAPLTDQIADTVDYVQLAQTAVSVSGSRSFDTLEALAATILDQVLAGHSSVRSVDITVNKLIPPTGLSIASTGVRMVRER